MFGDAAGLNLPHATTAGFSCNNKLVPCLDGTRKQILDELYQWIGHDIGDISQEGILTSSDHLNVMGTRQIYWINGVAGSGKTTIAYTAAELCEDKGNLAAVAANMKRPEDMLVKASTSLEDGQVPGM